MKRQFILILLFYWVFHFAIPYIDFLLFGFVSIYSDVEGYMGLIVNTLSVFGAIAIINFIPSPTTVREPQFNFAVSFFLISLFVSGFKFISGGGFEGAISGVTHGTLISYLSLFFNVQTAFLIALSSQRNIRHILILTVSYVLLMTMMGSRSAVIGLVLIIIILPLFSNNDIVRKKFLRFVIVLGLISPILFYLATSVRGDIDKKDLGELIIGRISLIELSQIPIEAVKNKSIDIVTFEEKYSLINQFKLIFNAISPIDPFSYDVAPNQYFRVAFLGANDTSVIDNYWSINLTLPVYFVLTTNLFWGVLMSILFISFIFVVWVRYSSNFYLFILIIISLYDILYFFDWVMVVQNMFSVFLTIFAMKKFDQLLSILRANKYKQDIVN